MLEIRKAVKADALRTGRLALELWPDHSAEDLAADFSALLQDEDAAVFLAYRNDEPIGFAQCQLRRDYVEGTESSPVGYLEGIYVAETLRRKGIARSLLSACESWARSRGCTEFASDCELDNTDSLRFHLNMGFHEAGRIICFTKQLEK